MRRSLPAGAVDFDATPGVIQLPAVDRISRLQSDIAIVSSLIDKHEARIAKITDPESIALNSSMVLSLYTDRAELYTELEQALADREREVAA